ncbi:MAG: hypothetical protein ABIK53_07270 [bacterium]
MTKKKLGYTSVREVVAKGNEVLNLDIGDTIFQCGHHEEYFIQHDNFVKYSIERNTKIVFNLMEKKQLSVKLLLSHMVKPYEIARAYEGLRNNKDEYIGVIIDWNWRQSEDSIKAKYQERQQYGKRF